MKKDVVFQITSSCLLTEHDLVLAKSTSLIKVFFFFFFFFEEVFLFTKYKNWFDKVFSTFNITINMMLLYDSIQLITVKFLFHPLSLQTLNVIVNFLKLWKSFPNATPDEIQAGIYITIKRQGNITY